MAVQYVCDRCGETVTGEIVSLMVTFDRLKPGARLSSLADPFNAERIEKELCSACAGDLHEWMKAPQEQLRHVSVKG